MMNIATKPMANSIGVVKRIEPPQIVPIQLKIFTPVGHRDQHRGEREERVRDRAQAGR